jgi:uncharacterized protein (TIGR02217 family)
MSSQVFPTLAGLGWSVKRTALWKTRTQESVSGKRTRTAFWSYPRWQWELTFDVLRQGALSGTSYAEFAQLAGFFNARQGAFDSFLYQDPDDRQAIGQLIGTGDGATTTFQLVRSFGGYVEPVFASVADGVRPVYVNGVPVASLAVGAWGSAAPGLVTFSTAPPAGAAVTADFNFCWPCAFDDDALDFEKFMATLYQAKSVKFSSLK